MISHFSGTSIPVSKNYNPCSQPVADVTKFGRPPTVQDDIIIFVIVQTNCYQSQQSKNLMEIPWIIRRFSIDLLATLLTDYLPKRNFFV